MAGLQAVDSERPRTGQRRRQRRVQVEEQVVIGVGVAGAARIVEKEQEVNHQRIFPNDAKKIHSVLIFNKTKRKAQ